MSEERADSTSPLREMLRDAGVAPFRPLRTLAEARLGEGGYVILEGDDGGMVYVVAPAKTVVAEESALTQLMLDLDLIAWTGGQPDMCRLYFERREAGGVPGGTGGGMASAKTWIHPEFVAKGLGTEIMAVLSGTESRLRKK